MEQKALQDPHSTADIQICGVGQTDRILVEDHRLVSNGARNGLPIPFTSHDQDEKHASELEPEYHCSDLMSTPGLGQCGLQPRKEGPARSWGPPSSVAERHFRACVSEAEGDFGDGV